jgi:hypothetical protein
MSSAAEAGILDVDVVRFSHGEFVQASDVIAVEEPLEIQVRTAGESDYRPVCMTMRTTWNWLRDFCSTRR